MQIWSGNIVFTQGSDPKDVIGWSSAIQELLTLGFCRDLNGIDQIFELTQDGLNYLEKGLRDRFETGSDVYVVATVRKSYEGIGAPPDRQLVYVVRMARSLIESEGIEWNYDFILQDEGFRNQILSRILEAENDDSWPYKRSWQWEKLEFYEGDPKSLGRDYKQMGNGCLIWEQKAQ